MQYHCCVADWQCRVRALTAVPCRLVILVALLRRLILWIGLLGMWAGIKSTAVRMV